MVCCSLESQVCLNFVREQEGEKGLGALNFLAKPRASPTVCYCQPLPICGSMSGGVEVTELTVSLRTLF